MRWAGHVARIGKKRNVYRLLVEKPEGKRLLGRPRSMWVDSIKMNLLKVVCDGVEWIGLARDSYRLRALVNLVMNIRVLQNAAKLSSGYTNGGLSCST
jgi:hypothetical protein